MGLYIPSMGLYIPDFKNCYFGPFFVSTSPWNTSLKCKDLTFGSLDSFLWKIPDFPGKRVFWSLDHSLISVQTPWVSCRCSTPFTPQTAKPRFRAMERLGQSLQQAKQRQELKATALETLGQGARSWGGQSPMESRMESYGNLWRSMEIYGNSRWNMEHLIMNEWIKEAKGWDLDWTSFWQKHGDWIWSNQPQQPVVKAENKKQEIERFHQQKMVTSDIMTTPRIHMKSAGWIFNG